MVRKNRGGMRYSDEEPKVSGTGVGKDYDGFRIFHTRKTDRVEFILIDGTTRFADKEETEMFSRDLAEASRRDRALSRYLEEFPSLRSAGRPAPAFKPEPEPPMHADQGGDAPKAEAERAASGKP